MLQRLFAITVGAALFGALVSACGALTPQNDLPVPPTGLGAARSASAFPNLGIGNGDFQRTIYLYGYTSNACPWSVSPTPVPFIPPRSAGGYYLTHDGSCAPSNLVKWTIFYGLKPRNAATTCALDVAYTSGQLVYSVVNGSSTACFTQKKSNQQIFAYCPGDGPHCFEAASGRQRAATFTARHTAWYRNAFHG